MVTVNDSQYGGSGGDYAVFAGGNGEAHEIALHELSHAFSDSADEYVTINGSYSGPEPAAVNVDQTSDRREVVPLARLRRPA